MARERCEDIDRHRLLALGRRITELRTQHRWSQDTLATDLQITPAHLADIEHGEKEPDLHLVWHLADAFGVTPSELLHGL